LRTCFRLAQIRVSNKFISSANITKDLDRSTFRLAIEHPIGSDARSEELSMQWKEITEERYMEALETARPKLWLSFGFLRGGKPIQHHECRVMKQTQPTYAPFVIWKGKYWEGSESMTVAEFAVLDLDTVGPSN
jgi:hypothetical protein